MIGRGKNTDTFKWVIGIPALVVVLLLTGWVAFNIANWRCTDILYPDMNSRYDIFAAQCMIETEQGWIPEERYRVVP